MQVALGISKGAVLTPWSLGASCTDILVLVFPSGHSLFILCFLLSAQSPSRQRAVALLQKLLHPLPDTR